MSNIAVLAMFIAVEATVILTLMLTVGALIRMSKQIENINNVYYESFKTLTDAYNGLRDIDDSRQEVYKKIIEADEKMNEAYKKGIETDKEILNAWRDIEETYSATYEEYRHCIEKIEALESSIKEIEKYTVAPFQIDVDEVGERDPFYALEDNLANVDGEIRSYE